MKNAKLPFASLKIVGELTSGAAYSLVPLANIRQAPNQPRKIFSDKPLLELAASIAKIGVKQPILLRPRTEEIEGQIISWLEIVCGERRFRASIMANKKDIPAIIEELDDDQVREIQIVENLQREDLSPIEEAQAFFALKEERNFTGEQLARTLNKSKAYIFAALKLCDLHPDVQAMVADGRLSKSNALPIARIPLQDLQIKAAEHVSANDLSARDAEAHVIHRYCKYMHNARFLLDDANLVPSAGPCSTCAHRSINQARELATEKSVDVCTNTPCFDAKAIAHIEQMKAAARDAGKQVFVGDDAKKIKPQTYCSELKNGWINVDSNVYLKGKSVRIRDVLGEDLPATALLLEVQRSGEEEPLHIAKSSAINQLLEKHGLKLEKSHGNTAQKTKEKELAIKLKCERTYRKELFLAVREKAPCTPDIEVLRVVGLRLFKSFNGHTLTPLLKIHGLDSSILEWQSRDECIKFINSLNLIDLTRFIVDLSRAEELAVESYNITTRERPHKLESLAIKANIEYLDIRKKVYAAAAPATAKKGKQPAINKEE